MSTSPISNWLKAIRWIAVLLIVLVSVWLAIQFSSQKTEERANIGGDFTLINQDGKSVSWNDFRGKPVLIYFGYAYCPDVCPTALQEMGAALEMIGKDADRFQSMFITIDPERDTPALLAQYVGSNGFPNNMIGLTGSPGEIDQVAKKWLVIYRRSSEVRDAGDYLMDHSSVIYLMAADGTFVTAFNHEDSPQLLAQCLRDHLAGEKCRR